MVWHMTKQNRPDLGLPEVSVEHSSVGFSKQQVLQRVAWHITQKQEISPLSGETKRSSHLQKSGTHVNDPAMAAWMVEGQAQVNGNEMITAGGEHRGEVRKWAWSRTVGVAWQERMENNRNLTDSMFSVDCKNVFFYFLLQQNKNNTDWKNSDFIYEIYSHFIFSVTKMYSLDWTI